MPTPADHDVVLEETGSTATTGGDEDNNDVISRQEVLFDYDSFHVDSNVLLRQATTITKNE